MVEVYEIPPLIARGEAKHLRKSVLSTLKFWLEDCPMDFQNEALYNAFSTFLDFDLSRDNKDSVVKELRSTDKKRLKTAQRKLDIYSVKKDKKKYLINYLVSL